MSYKEMQLSEIIDLATHSSGEVADIGGILHNYENGLTTHIFDAETTIFLASARSIVLELARRLRETEQQLVDKAIAEQKAKASILWIGLNDMQRSIILSARLNYATIGDWEQETLKEARRLQAQGYITLDLIERHNHAYEVNLTLKARELLSAAKV